MGEVITICDHPLLLTCRDLKDKVRRKPGGISFDRLIQRPRGDAIDHSEVGIDHYCFDQILSDFFFGLWQQPSVKSDLKSWNRVGRPKQLANRLEKVGDGSVVAFELRFQLCQFRCQLPVAGEQLPQLHKGADNGHAHRHGSGAAKHTCEPGHALFGKHRCRLARAAPARL